MDEHANKKAVGFVEMQWLISAVLSDEYDKES